MRTQARYKVVDRWITGVYPARYGGDGPHARRGDVEDHAAWGAWREDPARSDAALDALVVDAAFQLEFRARRWFAERQGAGAAWELAAGPWSRAAADDMLRLLHRHRPGPEACAHLDRALAWWQAARAAGLRVVEPDPPGYDDVTAAFDGFAAFAPAAGTIDPGAHGVEVVRWSVPAPSEPLPDALVLFGGLALFVALGLALFVWLLRL